MTNVSEARIYERQILSMLDSGMRRSDIARDLGIDYHSMCSYLWRYHPERRLYANFKPDGVCIYCGTECQGIEAWKTREHVTLCSRRCGRAFFENDKMFMIYDMISAGIRYKDIAVQFGTHQPTITNYILKAMEYRKSGKYTNDEKHIWLRSRLCSKTTTIKARQRIIDKIDYPEYCPILGIKMDYSGSSDVRDNAASIDRKIPKTLGGKYVLSNIWIISNIANLLKTNNKYDSIEDMRNDIQPRYKDLLERRKIRDNRGIKTVPKPYKEKVGE